MVKRLVRSQFSPLFRFFLDYVVGRSSVDLSDICTALQLMLTWERDQFVYVTMSDFIETRDVL